MRSCELATRAAVLASLLLASTATAAPYLQHEVDAQRTGATNDEGPARLDVAVALTLPSVLAARSPILILEGHVYALVAGSGEAYAPALLRIGLDDAEIEELLTFDANASSLASDGERIFVATADALRAYSVASGDEIWATPYPTSDAYASVVTCAPLAVADDDVLAACTPDRFPRLPSAEPGTAVPMAFAMLVDRSTGELRWTWEVPLTADGNIPVAGAYPSPQPQELRLQSAIIVRDRVVVSGIADGGDGLLPNPHAARLDAYALDRADGSLLWRRSATTTDANAPNAGVQPTNTPEGALASDGQLVLHLGFDLRAYDAASGAEQWRLSLRPAFQPGRIETPSQFTGSALAFARGRIYATAYGHLHALDATQSPPTAVWTTPLPSPTDWEGTHTVLAVGGRAYAAGFNLELFTADAATGRVEYRDDLPGNDRRGIRIAAGDGVVAYASPLGDLRVLGETPAAIGLVHTIDNAFPRPGEPVRIDLSRSRPGRQSAETEFYVDWGDGTPAQWGAAAVHEHLYEREGRHEVLLQARNGAGQTSSAILVVDVGGTAPSEPTLMERAFSRENQDTTWGVIGIALAAGGGVVAVGRSRQRRHRVQRELSAIDAAFASTRDRPRECEAALVERRARVQGLGLDGKLDQGDVVLLSQRIDELSRELRIGTIDREFHFLPHGFVLSLKEMLADGVVSVWEHEHLLHALERDRSLSDDQKERVRQLLASWAERDTERRRAG